MKAEKTARKDQGREYMSCNTILVNILHTPPPDGDDASVTYASRASDFFLAKDKDDSSCIKVVIGYVGPLIINDDAGLPWRISSDDDAILSAKDSLTAETQTLTLFLISCAADGSVDRSVRKIMRKLKAKDTDAGIRTVNSKYAVAALGHARCENSANQMADTIFGTGKRFHKTLTLSSLFDGSMPKLETQVELCAPEQEFDPWLELLFQLVKDECSK